MLRSGLGRGDRHGDLFLLANLAILHFEAGNFEASMSCTADLVRSDSDLQTPWARRIAYALRGLCSLKAYNLALAKDCYDEVCAASQSHFGSGDISYIEQFYAGMLVHHGNRADAVRRLREGASRMRPVNVFACSRLELALAELVNQDASQKLISSVLRRHADAGPVPAVLRAKALLSVL
jgi:hypothetical protein